MAYRSAFCTIIRVTFKFAGILFRFHPSSSHESSMPNPDPWNSSFSKSFRIGDSARKQSASSSRENRRYCASSNSNPTAAMPPKPSLSQLSSRFTASRSEAMTRPNRPAPSHAAHATTEIGQSGRGAVRFSQSPVQGILIPPFISPTENRSTHSPSCKSCNVNYECHTSSCHEHTRKQRQSKYPHHHR